MDLIRYSIKDWHIDAGKYGIFKEENPCSLFSALIDSGKIKHPYYDGSEEEILSIAGNGCEFTAEFTVDDEHLKRKNQILRLKGLDTICNVILNGQKIGETKNFFRTYEFNCKNIIKRGLNILKLHFYSPTEYIAEKEKTETLWAEVITMKGAAHLRKPIYTFGWDWAPAITDMGIFGGVELISYDSRLTGLDVSQLHDCEGVTLSIKTKGEIEGGCYLRYSVFDGDKKVASTTSANKEEKLLITSPKLWWPRGYGEQNLYTLKIELLCDNELIDGLSQTIGLRTIKIDAGADEIGRKFQIEVNSLKIFAFGADYVPVDSILPHITGKRVRETLALALFQNCNLIRVWGGGYYPDEDFYDFCDKNGLLVWLDYMVACEDVRLKDGGKEEYVAEFIENVNAVKHRACLALICGNNESEDKLKDRRENRDAVRDYVELFEKQFPKIMGEIAPEVFYWQSSPSNTGSFDKTNDVAYADSHCWGVWFADKPYDYYKGEAVRFCSEFGYESVPCLHTVKSFVDADKAEVALKQLRARERTGVFDGIEKIVRDINERYGEFCNLSDFIYLSQLLQAKAISEGVKYFRSIRGICMGSVYWQLNDCWPCVSHSSADYFGRKKALSFAMKRLYAPVLLIAEREKDKLRFIVANETVKDVCGKVKWEISDCNFKIIEEGKIRFKSKGLSATVTGETVISPEIQEISDRVYLSAKLFDDKDEIISEETMLFVKPKEFFYNKASVKFDILRKDGENCVIKISSDAFVHKLCVEFGEIDVDLSENYFDITDKKEKAIDFKYVGDIESLKKSVSFKCLNNILRR